MKKLSVAASGNLHLGGKVATTKQVMNAIAEDLLTMKEQGADLRVQPTFEFVPTEEPRVTKKANFDRRYDPTPRRKTADGHKDLRFGRAWATAS